MSRKCLITNEMCKVGKSCQCSNCLFHIEYHRLYNSTHRIEQRDFSKAYLQTHPIERELYQQQYYQRTKDSRRWDLIKNKLRVLDAYSQGMMRCACCGESEYDFLTIDHMNNDGSKQRRDKIHPHGGTAFYKWLINNNFPDGFQVLCMNCNFGKRINKGVCPHTER